MNHYLTMGDNVVVVENGSDDYEEVVVGDKVMYIVPGLEWGRWYIHEHRDADGAGNIFGYKRPSAIVSKESEYKRFYIRNIIDMHFDFSDRLNNLEKELKELYYKWCPFKLKQRFGLGWVEQVWADDQFNMFIDKMMGELNLSEFN